MKFECGKAKFNATDVAQGTAYAERIGGSGPLMVEFNGEYIEADKLEEAQKASEVPAVAATPAAPAVAAAPAAVPPKPVAAPVVGNLASPSDDDLGGDGDDASNEGDAS